MNEDYLQVTQEYYEVLRLNQNSKIKSRILKNLPEEYSSKVKLEVTLDELNELDDYYKNRNYEPRVNKVVPALKKDIVEQINANLYECAVGVYLDNVGPHKPFDISLFDGHTRRYAWKTMPELRPRKIYITIQLIRDENHADNVYFSYNTKKSAETTSETVTGILSSKNFNPKSREFQRGNIRTIIDKAFKYYVDENGDPMFSLKHSDDIELANSLDERIEFFIDELKFLDELISKPNFAKQYKNTTLLIPLLMIIAKYGVEHERVKLLAFNLLNRIQEYNDTKLCDGLTYCINTYFVNHDDWHKKTSEKNIREHSPIILKLFECFINDDRLRPLRPRVFKNQDVANEYFTMFFINDYEKFINKPRNYDQHLRDIS